MTIKEVIDKSKKLGILDEKEEENTNTNTNTITIDGDEMEVNFIKHDSDYYGVECWEIDTDYVDYIVFNSREDAELSCSKYWQDMAENDPAEFRCIVGDERIIELWSNGTTLEEFCDEIGNEAELHWASYDHHEIDGIDVINCPGFEEEIKGIDTANCVVYRRN